MLRDGFLRFCNDPEIACCKAEAELGRLRTENAQLRSQLQESQRRERAYAEAIKRHYADMTSQCFICYSCVNHDAREKAQWDGKKLENYACSGCGSGKPKWQFDVGRFSQEVAK